jgi:hypothetical protein
MSDFWEMDVADLNIAIKAFKDRKREELKRQVYQAYLISRWVWAKRVDIDKVLKEIDNAGEEKREMTAEQMLAQAKALNTLFGGTER